MVAMSDQSRGQHDSSITLLSMSYSNLLYLHLATHRSRLPVMVRALGRRHGSSCCAAAPASCPYALCSARAPLWQGAPNHTSTQPCS